MQKESKKRKHKKTIDSRGFSLVEMIIVVSIFSILLGVLVPSLNSVLGFRVQRATNSIAAALDKTRIEAMSRLVGEMKLEKRSDGYYISYYLDRGKTADVKEDEAEKIAPAGMSITYTTYPTSSPAGPVVTQQSLTEGSPLIITYNRSTGEFLPIQSASLKSEDILNVLRANGEIPFRSTDNYCKSITISGGFRTRTITLDQPTGKYTISVG